MDRLQLNLQFNRGFATITFDAIYSNFLKFWEYCSQNLWIYSKNLHHNLPLLSNKYSVGFVTVNTASTSVDVNVSLPIIHRTLRAFFASDFKCINS